MLKAKYLIIGIILLVANSHVWSQMQLSGWVEQVTLVASNAQIEAKIDTGARHSSLHCGCEFFRRNDKTWARIRVPTKNKEHKIIETPVIRFVNIKRLGSEPQRRAVVHLELCLGGISKLSEVNLTDRSGYNFPLLVGRSFLSGDFSVNPAGKNLLKAQCL